MVCCDAEFECYNSSGTVVFYSWMPSSCCHSRKSMLLLLYCILHSTLSGIIKMTAVWREHVQRVSSELHFCYVDRFGFVISSCLSVLPFIDPPLHFISAVFCCSNSFNPPQPKWQLCQDSGSKQHYHSENSVYYICCIHYCVNVRQLLLFLLFSPAT